MTDFSDFTPPLDLVREQWLTERPSVEAQRIATFFTRWGAEQAADRLRGQWPEPLTPQQQHAMDALDHILKHSTTNLGEATIRRAILGGEA